MASSGANADPALGGDRTLHELQLRRIVVGVKPWERGLPIAAAHARQLAQSIGAELRLVGTVYDGTIAAGCERGAIDAKAARERTMGTVRVSLERLAHSLREWGAHVSTQVVWGAPIHEGIIAAARQWSADLVVVGGHDGAPFWTRLTDTDWQLMRHVSCPLLLIKNPQFDGYRTIVAAVDPLRRHAEPEGLDRAVLAAGRCFASAFGSTLRAAHAYPGAAAFALASAVEVAPGVFYGAENVEALHRRALNELVSEYGIGAAETDLLTGPPAEALLEVIAARNAELVIVGAPRRRSGLAAIVGSTAEAVAMTAPSDVLIVPMPVE